jgi:hypothetical protein
MAEAKSKFGDKVKPPPMRCYQCKQIRDDDFFSCEFSEHCDNCCHCYDDQYSD